MVRRRSSQVNLRAYTALLLVVVAFVVLLGMPLMLASPMHHEMSCPFMPGQAAMCRATILEHLKHWQSAFATILAELLLITAFACVALWQRYRAPPERRFEKMRIRSRVPDRPAFLQELFSNGILNPKVF